MSKVRYLDEHIKKTLKTKMVFLGGPRQVGKTTLSLQYLKPSTVQNPAYLNWDRSTDKKLILKDQLPLQSRLLVFDEIHKYKKWRNLMKGLFDKYRDHHRFIVTGSARLDYFRKGGDSLLGRFRYYRLHPFSIMELQEKPTAKSLADLMQFGGFPEAFFAKDANEHRLWLRERVQKVIQEDLRDLETVKDTSLVLMLAEMLPEKVGAPLSLNSLVEDLQVSTPTIKRWLEMLSHLYYCYAVAPFGSKKIRAVKKLQKMYMWDWSQVETVGLRFENLVASQLLKYCHFIEDTEGHVMELRYLRDTDGREIDFVVLKNKKPLFAVECKTGEKNISPHIHYFKMRTDIPAFYQVHMGTKDYGSAVHGRALPFITFCKEMGMP